MYPPHIFAGLLKVVYERCEIDLDMSEYPLDTKRFNDVLTILAIN
jgi:hypothetical protein